MSEDVLLPAGTRVRYDGLEDGGEYGIVVHSWFGNEIAGHDCYVAFFGKAFPTGAPDQKPYVLRYASASLAVVREAPD
ncbi:MAG: hypothetical protein ABL889_20320 [Terricaulis sp.]